MEEWKESWRGRITDLSDGPLYWYQAVRFGGTANVSNGSIVLSGYPYDLGVKLNQGRVGAADGPNAIRRMLASCALPLRQLDIIDTGNIFVSEDELTVEKLQETLAERTKSVLVKGGIAVNLGGGHDISAGTGFGLGRAFSDQKIGMVNFDAHFDLRRDRIGANSGTPFYQLLKHNQSLSYLVLGIQNASNTNDLFRTAEEFSVKYVEDELISWKNLNTVKEDIISYLENIDIIHLSIDMDVFSSAFAPGVSAPNPLGMEPKIALELLEAILHSGKVKAIDIAEVNPKYDLQNRTAKLAGRLIAKIAEQLS